MQYQVFTLLEWAEFFGQGMVDTADFILNLCFQKSDIELDEMPPIAPKSAMIGDHFEGGIYVSVDVRLDCGCRIRDIRVFAEHMRQQRGWDVAVSNRPGNIQEGGK